MRGVVNSQECGWAQANGIALQHPDPIHSFQMTMTFAEEAGKTPRTWRIRHSLPPDYRGAP
jgi:hypothetical protein